MKSSHLNLANSKSRMKLQPLPETPLLSIVLTSYSMERLQDVVELLGSIKNQTYPKIEVIYIVEKSLDLLKWVKTYVKNIENVKVLFNDGNPGLAQARNIGLKNARGEIIAFIDDDVLLPKNWADEMVKTYKLDDSIIGVTGSAEPLWEDESMKWLPKEFYWLISCTDWAGLNRIAEVRSAWGMNMSFRREIFTLCGLFNTKISGYHKPIAEDLEFSLRARSKTGMQIIYNSNVKIWHRVYKFRLGWKFIIKRSYHIGISRYVLKKFYREINVKMFDREYRLGKLILIKFLPETFMTFFRDPIIFFKRISLLVVSLLFIGFGFLHGYLKYSWWCRGFRAFSYGSAIPKSVK